MISDIYANLLYFLNLTSDLEVLWLIFPLVISTLIMLAYFERYYKEQPGWNTYVANSLVLLFISMILFRHIYNLGDAGAINFLNFPFKFIFSFGILLIGIIILFLNFRHLLPEKIAKFISSPLTLNLIAYTGILFVYSDLKADWEIIFALLILFFIFLFVLNLMRIPIKKLFLYIEKMKEKEKKADLSHEKTNVKFLKGEIKNLKREKDVIKAEKRTAKKYLTKKNKLVGNKTPKILLMSFMIFFLLVVVGLFFVKQNFITGFVVDSIEDEEVSLKVFYSFFIIGVSLLTVFLNLRKFKKKK